jgi:hypothetical protein
MCRAMADKARTAAALVYGIRVGERSPFLFFFACYLFRLREVTQAVCEDFDFLRRVSRVGFLPIKI